MQLNPGKKYIFIGSHGNLWTFHLRFEPLEQFTGVQFGIFLTPHTETEEAI